MARTARGFGYPLGAGSLDAEVGAELVLDDGVLLGEVLLVLGGVLLGGASRVLGGVLGGVLLGAGFPMAGGAFVVEWLGPDEVVRCGVDGAVVLGVGCADDATRDPLRCLLLPDPAGTVFATGANGAVELVWRLFPRVLPAWCEGGATLSTG
jgi:hypothetical protein